MCFSLGYLTDGAALTGGTKAFDFGSKVLKAFSLKAPLLPNRSERFPFATGARWSLQSPDRRLKGEGEGQSTAEARP